MSISRGWYGLLVGICIVLMGSAPGWGEEAWDAAPFVRIGAGARAIALGRAYVSLCGGDPNAAFWNPAGFAWARHITVSASHRVAEDPIFDYSFSALSGVFPIPFKLKGRRLGAFGFGVLCYGVDDIDWFTRDAIWVGTFRDIERAVMFSYANRYGPVAIGVSVKYLYRKFEAEKGWMEDRSLSWDRLGWDRGFGVDFGMLLYQQGLKLGLMLRDNLWDIAKVGNDRISEDFTFGGSYDRMWSWSGMEMTTVGAVALEQVKHRPLRLHLGAEVRMGDWKGFALTLRGGRSNYPLEKRGAEGISMGDLVEADTKHHVGFGVSWRRWLVDYAFSLGTLDDVGFVSLQYGTTDSTDKH